MFFLESSIALYMFHICFAFFEYRQRQDATKFFVVFSKLKRENSEKPKFKETRYIQRAGCNGPVQLDLWQAGGHNQFCYN
jgi:hypothetical protein